MTDTDVLHIRYAPAPRLHQRRWVRRVAVLLSLSPLCLLAGVQWAPRAWDHARLLARYRQSLNYLAPQAQVVYDDDRTAASALVAGSTPYELVSATGRLAAVRNDDPWEQFYQLYSPPGRQLGPVLFLHQRQNSRGERRLVVVEGWLMRGVSPFALRASVLRQTSPFATPRIVGSPQLVMLPALLELESKHLRWHAGQIDSADAAHFTIGYEINGKPCIVDGWLRDDDTVTFAPREVSPDK